MNEIEMVQAFLRGQNLEQLGRVDEAIDLYEAAVADGFDAIGPYDRLISLYARQARHVDVIRICDAALAQVRTYDDKRAWYERIRGEAAAAGSRLPKPAPKKG